MAADSRRSASAPRRAAAGWPSAASTARCCCSRRRVVLLLAMFAYPFLYGLQLSLRPQEGGGLLANYRAFFSDSFESGTIVKTLKLAVPATAINVLASIPIAYFMRAPVPRQAAADRDPRRAGHARHGARRRGAAALPRPARLVQPHAAGARDPRRAAAPRPQLLGRPLLADHHRLPVRVPADPQLHVGHRPDARARRGDARGGAVAALPAHHAAAAGARARDDGRAVLRAGLRGLPVGVARRPAVGQHARALDRRLPRGLRGLRLLDGLGDRDDHGRRRARGHRPRCWALARACTRARAREARDEPPPRRTARRLARLGRRRRSS